MGPIRLGESERSSPRRPGNLNPCRSATLSLDPPMTPLPTTRICRTSFSERQSSHVDIDFAEIRTGNSPRQCSQTLPTASPFSRDVWHPGGIQTPRSSPIHANDPMGPRPSWLLLRALHQTAQAAENSHRLPPTHPCLGPPSGLRISSESASHG